ncbi:MAG TPA: tripartite tricarboxylate transporter substrate-binding protein [Xanthobacteraceae bacterium]|nr:tripartite tricarboxylate transporter substrate-binding protein [Xanthobacteraceae bacterium]
MTAVFCALLGGSAHADPVEDFFAGRQIKFILGSAGGGGYDSYSRLLMPFLSRHLPGHPSFVLQEMPGAAGMTAANHLYNIARRDGSEIGMVGRGVGIEPLLDPKDKAVRYVATNFNWIGTPQQEVGLVFVRLPSPIASMEDLKTHELIVSGTTSAAAPSYYPRLMNALLGTRFRVVEGYKSSQEALLALERGEVDGHCSGSSSAALRARMEPLISAGKVKILAQLGREKDPAYPDVPLILDLAANSADRRLLELAFTQQVMAWPVVAPPGVPAERVQALRTAFDAAMKDPDFLAEAARQKVYINPVSGEKIAALLEQLYASPKDVLDRAAALSERN